MNFIKSITQGKRICVFPYTKDSAMFILETINSFDNISIVSMPSSLFEGQDIAEIINFPPKGITVKNHINFKNYDVLLIPYSKNFPSKIIIEYVYKALAANLIVIDLGNIKDQEIINKINEFNNNMKLFYNIDDIEDYYKISDKFITYNKKYKKNDYYIIGIGKEFNDIQIADFSNKIKLSLDENEINALKISWDYNSYFFDDTICFSKKIIGKINNYSDIILMINNYINEIHTLFCPDVIILELYNSFMALNSEYLNDFGIFTYLISQAIEIDYLFICATANTFYSPKAITKIQKVIHDKFGVKIDGVYLTNNYFDNYHNYNNYRPNFYLDDKLYNQIISEVCNYDNYFSIFDVAKLKKFLYRKFDCIREK